MRIWWVLPLLLFSCAHHSTRDSSGPYSLAPRTSAHSRSCQPLTTEERQRLLEVADPSNFPATRYREGPNLARGVERETDCSHFVHEMYRRAGLPYAFRPTDQLGNAREFDILPEKDAQPGDLMLFRGHVGIVDENGDIISALRTRHRKRKSSIGTLARHNFRTIRGQRYVLRYRCRPSDADNRAVASERKKP